jgi:hypothetical protein
MRFYISHFPEVLVVFSDLVYLRVNCHHDLLSSARTGSLPRGGTGSVLVVANLFPEPGKNQDEDGRAENAAAPARKTVRTAPI